MRFTSFLSGGFALLLMAPARGEEPSFPAFRVQEIDHTLTVGYATLLVDLNGDRKPDILIADSRRVIWFENPKWTMHMMLAAQTRPDNVALAPVDVGGKLAIALGAGWKGYNTKDLSTVQVLTPGSDATEPWTAHSIPFSSVALHRVHAASIDGKPLIFAQPLLGPGATAAKNWSESTADLTAYSMPNDLGSGAWEPKVICSKFHVVHNFAPVDFDGDGKTELLIACYEGVWLLRPAAQGPWEARQIGAGEQSNPTGSRGASEVKLGKTRSGQRFIATIEPWHGNEVVVYSPPESGDVLWHRKVLDDRLKEGHGVWPADLRGTGGDDLIIGSRAGDPHDGRGVFVYTMSGPGDAVSVDWQKHVIDDTDMSAEDLAAADLNGDGKIDMVAAARATHNVRIYWNERK